MNVSRFVGANGDLIKPIQCEIEFVTPAFLGGADQSAELRSPPFKAALRWWWRVLFGAQYGADIFTQESKLFGSTDGASKVRIEINGAGLMPQKKDTFNGTRINVVSKGKPFKIDIIDYLAYGLYDYDRQQHKNVYRRNHFSAGARFGINIYAPSDKKDEVAACLQALFAFGGVGSRSRNGFGSLHLIKPSLISAYGVDLKQVKAQEYPTLNTASKLFETRQRFSQWNEALSEIAVAYRSAKSALEPRHQFETRGLLARPIEVRGENIPNEIRKGRSPKQFIMHIAKTADGKFVGRILSLPILFYDKDKRSRYDAMIQKMHTELAKTLVDKTGDISTLLGVSK
jgi:CRISPR-associated protein Cmr1